MSTVTDGATLHQGVQRFLRANPDLAARLQTHDGGTFEHDDINATDSQWGRLVAESIIQHANDYYKYSDAIEWEVNPAARTAIETAAAIDGPWPDCRHTGLRNLGDGEFSCGNDHCDAVYSRATAEEVSLR